MFGVFVGGHLGGYFTPGRLQLRGMYSGQEDLRILARRTGAPHDDLRKEFSVRAQRQPVSL